ncbi:Coatomer subunit beta'-1 [Capsicum annuum]|nr:Coatomer subunit beta'-1 [Capsicum annuum]
MERQMSVGGGERKRGKDSPGKRGDSPLHLAARAGNLETGWHIPKVETFIIYRPLGYIHVKQKSSASLWRKNEKMESLLGENGKRFCVSRAALSMMGVDALFRIGRNNARQMMAFNDSWGLISVLTEIDDWSRSSPVVMEQCQKALSCMYYLLQRFPLKFVGVDSNVFERILFTVLSILKLESFSTNCLVAAGVTFCVALQRLHCYPSKTSTTTIFLSLDLNSSAVLILVNFSLESGRVTSITDSESSHIRHRKMRKLAQRSERVKCVDLHPTEPWILASLYSGTVCIWNYQTQVWEVTSALVSSGIFDFSNLERCVRSTLKFSPLMNHVRLKSSSLMCQSDFLAHSTMAKSFEVTELPVRSAKFIARKQWVVAGADDMYIRVYNYNTMDKVKVFEAHTDYIRCVAVHPTLPYVLSSSDDMLIKLWDWEKGWLCTQIFEGHSHYVMQVTFNPKDTNTFASASLDRTIKIWNLGSPDPNFTLDAHLKGVNCVDYFTGGDKPYLITGSDDHTAKVWDYQTKSCVQTLEGHTHNVSAVCFHPELPIIITGSEDGTVRIWHATTYRLENTLNYGLERVWAIGYMRSSRRVVIGYDEGTIMVKIGREEPVASMDTSGKIIWAKHNEVQTVNIKSVGAGYEVTDGERLPLAVKELGTCDLYPQSLKHNPNGRFVVVCGDGEYIIYTALAWRNRSFGSALEFVWSSDGEYAVRESTSRIKIFSKNFQEKKSIRPTFSAERIYGGTLLAMCSNDFICFYDWADCRLIRRIDVGVKNLYWADSGDLVAIASDTSFYILKYNRDVVSAHLDSGRSVDEQGVEEAFELLYEINERVRTGIWVGDCFIYNNSSWRLNYCVGGEVTTMFHLDRPMYLLGYLANQSRVFLIDKEFNVIGYTLLLSLIEYKTLVMRGDWDRANEVLPSIPKEHHNSVAHFLESRGMVEEALEVATEPDYRFDLAIQLGKLDIAKDIAVVAQSESKWKQLGELAMSAGMLDMAEECLKYASDLSGLLLLYSSLGDAEGITELATLAKEQGKNNVTFLCMFLLGKVEECIQLLVDSNRIPEAAFMARSYMPSKVSEIVAIWKKDLSKVNQKAAEALADPEEYPNLFEQWQVACAVESRVAEERGGYPPATEYVNHADRSTNTLVEAFSNMRMDEEPLENGDMDHEVAEQSGDEVQELGQDDAQNEGQEEPVVVDVDSTDGAVLVNGAEAEEEWGTNTEGKPSA